MFQCFGHLIRLYNDQQFIIVYYHRIILTRSHRTISMNLTRYIFEELYISSTDLLTNNSSFRLTICTTLNNFARDIHSRYLTKNSYRAFVLSFRIILLEVFECPFQPDFHLYILLFQII